MRRIKLPFVSFLVFIITIIGITEATRTLGRAEDKFPTRPIEVIVGFAQGGGTDLMMRIIAEAVAPFEAKNDHNQQTRGRRCNRGKGRGSG